MTSRSDADRWYSVTYRGTAEMTVWVEADSAQAAKQKAEDGEYEHVTPIEFVKGRPYTMKTRKLPPDVNPEEWDL